MTRLVLWLACAALSAAETYQTPPKPILDVLRSPVPPIVSLSPAKTHIALIDVVRNPRIADLARPMLRLAGVRIDPASSGAFLTSYGTGVSLQSINGGEAVRVALPATVRLAEQQWSPDGKWLAAANATSRGTELWLIAVDSGKARMIAGAPLNSALGPAIRWSGSNRLLVTLVPAGRGPAPRAPEVPPGPKVQESGGNAGPARTFPDMLASPFDEELFSHYATSQLAFVDAVSGAVTRIGKPGLYLNASASPDGQHLLVTRADRPFSYLLPVTSFPREVAVLNAQGAVVHTVAKLPLSDRVPIEGVHTGPRNVAWVPSQPATLWWVEALDGGNPKETVPNRERFLLLTLPGGQPREFTKLEERLAGGFLGSAGVQWLEDGKALISDYERKSRRLRTFLVDAGGSKKLLFSRNQQDRYRDPGTPLTRLNASGKTVLDSQGTQLWLRGDGASPQGDFPFLDRFDLASGKTERVFQSDPEKFQEPIGVLSDGRLLIRSESPSEVPNYFLRDQQGRMTALTRIPETSPQLRAIQKRLVTYRRADGVPLSFTLYLPPDYRPGKPLPTVVWAYPREYNDADTASQITGSLKRYPAITGYSHLFFTLLGYAVLDNATMPVVGDPETANNTYIDQIVASAKAAIDKAVEMGVTDPERVGVGGHSYGAFMTANLLANSNLFRAGIARSGAYNRTLTPFGFQSERRTIWESPDVYLRMSPFLKADKIKAPILFIHGEADNNQGTFPIQSDRMYQAVRGNGGTARLVFLPFESHGYAAQESIEHTVHEMTSWFDRHVKNAPARVSSSSQD